MWLIMSGTQKLDAKQMSHAVSNINQRNTSAVQHVTEPRLHEKQPPPNNNLYLWAACIMDITLCIPRFFSFCYFLVTFFVTDVMLHLWLCKDKFSRRAIYGAHKIVRVSCPYWHVIWLLLSPSTTVKLMFSVRCTRFLSPLPCDLVVRFSPSHRGRLCFHAIVLFVC